MSTYDPYSYRYGSTSSSYYVKDTEYYSRPIEISDTPRKDIGTFTKEKFTIDFDQILKEVREASNILSEVSTVKEPIEEEPAVELQYFDPKDLVL